MTKKTKYMNYRIILILGLLIISAATISSSSAANTIYVNNATGNDDYDGTSATVTGPTVGPKATIQNGTDTVELDGTVNVADGIYKEAVVINKNVTLLGQSQTGTIIDGYNTVRPLTINSGTVTLINFTIQNGISTDGGGISNMGYLTITDTILKDNTATSTEEDVYGGGIYNEGTLTINNSTVSDNTATGSNNAYGGGIYNSGTLSIVNSTITNNTATTNNGYADGGGISNEFGTITINKSSITNNTASTTGSGGDVYGGGISNSFIGDLTINNSLIINNTATGSGGDVYGGGISNWGAFLTINHSTLAGNTAIGINGIVYGGGISNNGDSTITGTTLKDNTATSTGKDVYGGGIYNEGDLTITDSTITNNTTTGTKNGYGGGIYNEDYGTLTANFNRIVNNSPNAIYIVTPSVSSDVEYNWWGYNNPPFETLIHGTTPTRWLYMTMTADPAILNNGGNSPITVSFNNYSSDGTNYTPLPEPLAGHIPDNTPVNFQTDLGTVGSKSINKTTVNGIATATLNASEQAGTAHMNATTDNQTVYVNVLINPKSSIYLNITPDKINPVVGDTVTYRFKVGNNGPDPAENVVMTYKIPDGLVFVSANDNIGNKWTYDPNTRIITWNLGTVPVGDPDLWVSFLYTTAGEYKINPLLSTTTYDPDLNANTQSITVHAETATISSVNAATTNTVEMQNTGITITGIVLAILMVFGGIINTRKH
ncbi:DUF11 domain-containing protein [Methanobacterium sp.]|uniref:DUF11 domain-containing protein n=1 Tax=Methanobacterium sp. TaxID=2164 RepID=UPI002ABB4848|nr:DUF11 domain-containing protein [Methanobacterium sp.]MDY9923176.1 DUF11 domain-containing protein [Methanobacterium sp.]